MKEIKGREKNSGNIFNLFRKLSVCFSVLLGGSLLSFSAESLSDADYRLIGIVRSMLDNADVHLADNELDKHYCGLEVDTVNGGFKSKKVAYVNGGRNKATAGENSELKLIVEFDKTKGLMADDCKSAAKNLLNYIIDVAVNNGTSVSRDDLGSDYGLTIQDTIMPGLDSYDPAGQKIEKRIRGCKFSFGGYSDVKGCDVGTAIKNYIKSGKKFEVKKPKISGLQCPALSATWVEDGINYGKYLQGACDFKLNFSHIYPTAL